MHARRHLLRAAPLAALLLAVACGDAPSVPSSQSAPTPVPTPVVAQIDIVGGDAPLLVDGTRQLSARLHAADGTALDGRSVVWTSSDTAVATVSPQGVVLARAIGQAVIAASAGVARAEVRQVVAPVAVARVQLSRSAVAVAAGEVDAVGAVPLAADGRVLLDRPVTFTSGDTAVFVVNADGRLRGIHPGRATLRVESEGVRAETRVEVSAGALGVGASRWTLRVSELAGAGVRCTLDGITLAIAQHGDRVAGELAPGASVACQPVPGARPPYATPEAPHGPIEGTVVGRTVTLRAPLSRWFFEGTLAADGRTLEGTAAAVDAAAVDPVLGDVIAPLRTGRFTAVRAGL